MANFNPPQNNEVVREVEEYISSLKRFWNNLREELNEHLTNGLQQHVVEEVVPIVYDYQPNNSILENYPIYWQGTLALNNDKALVKMHYLFGNAAVAEHSLQRNIDGEFSLSQCRQLEQTLLDDVTHKMQIEDKCCVLIAVPIGKSEEEWNQQSSTLHNGFITYLQQEQAVGIIDIKTPEIPQSDYIVHVFPPCEYMNDVLAVHSTLVDQIASIEHLIIVISTL